MHRFKVWAPTPDKVALSLDGKPVAMQGPDEHGWWTVDVDAAGNGTDYGYLISGDEKSYADPRSQWQPHGVHGLSRVYDQSKFQWGDADFRALALAQAVIYELHVGTFTTEGTLDAATGKLEYLRSLGVTHVELMPVAAFAGDRGWGYDGVALFAVHEPYGGPDALKRFVDAAHRHNLAVLLDVVYNHFGPVGNYTGKYGPYLIDAHKTPWGGAVNLEEGWSDEVRRFLCDNALMWMRDYHIDGLRLDAVHAFVDRSAIHFLEQLSNEVEALSERLNRDLVLIAESDLNDPRVVTPRAAGGLGMDAQWSDDFHHALFAVLCGDAADGYYADFMSLRQLAKSIENNFVFDGNYSGFRNRAHGRPAGYVPPSKFIGYIQNHDQVGNRAIGDRIRQIAGFDRAQVAAALVLLGPFVPMIFEGEEWAASSPFQYFADHEDPEMAKLVAEGRKREFAPFGWPPELIPNPEAPETFEHSMLKWDEVDQGEHADMLAWYRDLIGIRRAFKLSDNAKSPRVEFDEEQKWLSMECGPLSVFCNLGKSERAFALLEKSTVLKSHRAVQKSGEILLEPDGVAIISSGR